MGEGEVVITAEKVEFPEMSYKEICICNSMGCCAIWDELHK